MAPKKRQNKNIIEETAKICGYHNRGYCYKKEDCDEKHPDKVCNDTDCNEDSCEKRHPNPCNFGFRCKFHKKKICLYSHVTFACDDGKQIYKLINL